MKSKHRILTLAHGHPLFSKGGGEIAARSMFKMYQTSDNVEDAWLLCAMPGSHSGEISVVAEREYVWDQGCDDYFYMNFDNRRSQLQSFINFIVALRPDVVHFHHGMHISYDLLSVIRRNAPEARIIFTLHEYLPICARDGQMVASDGELCSKPGVVACHNCMGIMSPGHFWAREQRFKHLFSLVDRFVAPSNFLKKRFVEWGIAEERVHVIENPLRALSFLDPRPITEKDGRRNRFAFFGRASPLKGLKLLFDALNLMSQDARSRLRLVVNATGLNEDMLPDEYKSEMKRYMRKYRQEGCVVWLGPYGEETLLSRMGDIDWVVTPSLWWENSPLVIQEAFACGRPVICSNIGGMAEKVRDGVDGMHVEMGNPQAWADALEVCVSDPMLWQTLRDGIEPRKSSVEILKEHLSLIKDI